MTIRKITMDDLDRVVELEQMIFSDPWSENVYRQTLLLPDCLYLGIVEEDIIVGLAGLRNIVGEGEITNVMVSPEYRRRGYMEKLLIELLKEGENMGVIDFTLEVRKSNFPAILLYEKLGFVTEGERPGFYSNPKENALIMWKRKKDI